MTQPIQTKKTSVKRTTKKRLLNKLPANLAAYNYEAFSYKDMQRAVTYFQAELGKIEKLLNKLPMVTQETKVSQGNPPVSNPYMDIYGSTQSQSKVSATRELATQPTKPEIIAPPLPYQPYTPGLQGDHMEMPSILGSSGVVVNTLKEDYQGSPTTLNGIQPVETVKLPVVEDNSSELRALLKSELDGK